MSSSSPPTQEEIRSLLDSPGSYSPSVVPQLEAYLLAHVNGDVPYMGDAVRGLVKMYQLYPDTMNERNIGLAYLVTMLQYPNSGSDLLAISYMIPQYILNNEPCNTIQRCNSLLESCQFADFWKVYSRDLQENGGDGSGKGGHRQIDATVQQVANRSVGSLQAAILSVLALTYKEAPTPAVTKALNVDSVESITGKDVHHKVIESANDRTVTFVSTANNSKRQRVYQEGVNFATISSLMNKIAQ